jgi:hypothetical protein
MILTLCKTLRKLRVMLVMLIALPLLALMLSMAPAPPQVRSSVPVHKQRTAIICLIGSICVDVSVYV